MKAVKTVILITVSLFALGGCSTGDKCQQIVKAKCTSCHSINKTCKQTGKSKEYWKTTVGQMIRLKAPITDNERKELVKCLAGTTTFNAVCNVQKGER